MSLQGRCWARLGVLRQVLGPAETDPWIIAHFDKTLTELRAAGAEIVDPFIVLGFEAMPRPLSASPAARFKDDLTQYFAKRPGMPFSSVKAIADSKLVHPLHQALFDAAAAAKPVEDDALTIEDLKNEARYKAAFPAAMDADRIDALVFPVWAQLPPINGDRNTQIVAEPKPAPDAAPTVLTSSLGFVASSLQWPAISVPRGFIEGLPQGLQIVGRAWDEARIIGYAYAYEHATHHRRPPPTTPSLPR
jgi:Asp-tRNA(Asn)/Glu-tRNA(Gln) amidotransferase A subunit family amidase